jgi:hypothetical protein
VELDITDLTDEWVNENFDEKMLQDLKDLADAEVTKFVSLPPGDYYDVKPTMDISKNPQLAYLNNENDICVYASLASALIYWKFNEDAKVIMRFSELTKWARHDKTVPFKTLLSNINNSSELKQFRKTYQVRRVETPTSTLCIDPNGKEDIYVMVIHATDNTRTHAIAMTGNYIFDSNCERALPRTKEGIDCSCGENASFVKFIDGYVWKRTNAFARLQDVPTKKVYCKKRKMEY